MKVVIKKNNKWKIEIMESVIGELVEEEIKVENYPNEQQARSQTKDMQG